MLLELKDKVAKEQHISASDYVSEPAAAAAGGNAAAEALTALCVLENAELTDTVTIDARMAGIEGSSMYLEVGETLTVEQLLYGLMLRSGNDAAVALALHVAGSVEDFVALMNRKAAELGLFHTHFANPHGLPAKEHYTTARELAAITCAACAW